MRNDLPNGVIENAQMILSLYSGTHANNKLIEQVLVPMRGKWKATW